MNIIDNNDDLNYILKNFYDYSPFLFHFKFGFLSDLEKHVFSLFSRPAISEKRGTIYRIADDTYKNNLILPMTCNVFSIQSNDSKGINFKILYNSTFGLFTNNLILPDNNTYNFIKNIKNRRKIEAIRNIRVSLTNENNSFDKLSFNNSLGLAKAKNYVESLY